MGPVLIWYRYIMQDGAAAAVTAPMSKSQMKKQARMKKWVVARNVAGLPMAAFLDKN